MEQFVLTVEQVEQVETDLVMVIQQVELDQQQELTEMMVQ
jgi:hypothetical protein